MREPPPKGSLRESLLMMYVLKKDLIEHARLRALATSIINKDKGAEAFDEYRKEAFPWAEIQKKRDNEQTIKLLNEEVKRGALGIRPLWEATKKIRSRMKTKVVEAEKPVVERSRQDIDRLFSKVRPVIS